MRPARLIAPVVTLFLLIGTAGAAHATDLLQTFRLAQQNDPAYAAARQDYKAAREARPQARGALLPQVTFSATWSEDDQRNLDTGGSDSFSNEQYRLALRQTLFNWEQFAGLSRADAAVAQAEAELADADQELILRVAERYFDVLAAEENERFARAEVNAIERQLEQAQERFEVGLIPVTDVKAAQASYDLAVSRQIEARNDIDDAREALRSIVERRVGPLARLRDDLPLESPDPNDADEWVARAVEQNPQFLAARAASEASRQGVRQARAGHYPEVDLVASRTRQERDSDAFAGTGEQAFGDTETDSIGIEVSISLFSGGATSSRSREARSQFEASQSRVIESRRAVEQRTRDSFRGLEARISQVRALRQAVESNEASVEATEAGFQVGTRTAVDVLDALRDLFAAERDYTNARFQYVLNRLRLQEAAGTLTVDELRLVNTWLESIDE